MCCYGLPSCFGLIIYGGFACRDVQYHQGHRELFDFGQAKPAVVGVATEVDQ